MNQSRMVHYAVACLEGLDIPMAPRDLSRSQKVPFEDCLHILQQFEAAGLVRKNAQGLIERRCSIEEVTALDVLQALWALPLGKALRKLIGTRKFKANQAVWLAARADTWPRG